MRIFLQVLMFLLLAPFVDSAAAPVAVGDNPATASTDRSNLAWWHDRFVHTLALAKAHPDARIVWLGDSITQFWQRTSPLDYKNVLPIWNEYYAPYGALDFGFAGDSTSNLIWRLNHSQVAGLHPQLAIILIGTNNLVLNHWDASQTIPGIKSVVEITHQQLPQAHILLLGVPPSIRSAWIDQQTALINAALATDYARSSTVTFVDISPALSRNGNPDPDLYVESQMAPPRPALHPDAAGMSNIAAYIQPEVKRYTGSCSQGALPDVLTWRAFRTCSVRIICLIFSRPA